MPANSTTANSVLLSSPTTPQRALNTTENTKVYTTNMNTGLKNDQAKPMAESLYRPTTSRLVICTMSCRLRHRLLARAKSDVDCAVRGLMVVDAEVIQIALLLLMFWLAGL